MEIELVNWLVGEALDKTLRLVVGKVRLLERGKLEKTDAMVEFAKFKIV